jgi:hypothetical protein
MAAPTGAFVLKDATVTIDSVEYANQCTKAQLTPDQPVQTVRTLVPDGVVSDVDSAAWTFDISALQINGSGGLAKALRDADPGDTLACVLAPSNGTGNAKATFTILVLDVPFGGEQGNFATFEASFPVVGSPVFGTLS